MGYRKFGTKLVQNGPKVPARTALKTFQQMDESIKTQCFKTKIYVANSRFDDILCDALVTNLEHFGLILANNIENTMICRA